MAPHGPGFRAPHPDIKLSFDLTDSVVDLVREGSDMGIRIGEVTDPNYVAVRLYPNLNQTQPIIPPTHTPYSARPPQPSAVPPAPATA
ncbi:LysR substrate-binding domain-containing protein [Zoogloea sp.]|uniref:LysR substrate-binding domain-containing protein n=1 Tax=Zoogloea sp. TaxID=49181 RepID=UPI0035ADC842